METVTDPRAEAGADGFVTANGSVAELVEAIERTAAGELLCSPRIAAQLLRRAAHQNRPAGHAAAPILTSREQQVFSLLKQGQSNKEIGSTLNIAEATVKNHVHHVLEHAIQRQSDFELLKDTRLAFQMLTEPTVPPDVVILGLTAEEDATLVPALFARWPTAQVMTVTQAGDDAAVYELRPRRQALGQMSPDEIIESLRQGMEGSFLGSRPHVHLEGVRSPDSCGHRSSSHRVQGRVAGSQSCLRARRDRRYEIEVGSNALVRDERRHRGRPPRPT